MIKKKLLTILLTMTTCFTLFIGCSTSEKVVQTNINNTTNEEILEKEIIKLDINEILNLLDSGKDILINQIGNFIRPDESEMRFTKGDKDVLETETKIVANLYSVGILSTPTTVQDKASESVYTSKFNLGDIKLDYTIKFDRELHTIITSIVVLNDNLIKIDLDDFKWNMSKEVAISVFNELFDIHNADDLYDSFLASINESKINSEDWLLDQTFSINSPDNNGSGLVTFGENNVTFTYESDIP